MHIYYIYYIYIYRFEHPPEGQSGAAYRAGEFARFALRNGADVEGPFTYIYTYIHRYLLYVYYIYIFSLLPASRSGTAHGAREFARFALRNGAHVAVFVPSNRLFI